MTGDAAIEESRVLSRSAGADPGGEEVDEPVAVDVVKVGAAPAVTVGDGVTLEEDAGRLGQSRQGFLGDRLSDAEQRGEDGPHLFFALAFFLPWLASATGS